MNDGRNGWIPPSADEARVLADPASTIYKPSMAYKITKTARRYRPQLSKDTMLRVLGLDNEQYLNMRGSAREIVAIHGLDKPDPNGMRYLESRKELMKTKDFD